ncbi:MULTISPECIES: hypothetical protein [Acinetobacter calcoaceticus/baumannii complex]|nr:MULTISPECIES: hypothetical protein [Acinetobacter calcoaceticus/baumannii complex]MBU3166843.1 hypothetical protein [Acinetobacter baumannii]MCU4548467.1 hypothetical protein [Acinetobacter pittii]MCW1520096.1 hypothetical protein [Acinetobacter baumannii]MCZ3098090.1 hypothetical protein [Acinetobacter baumannii]MDA3358901.1 hypothetical protein [Acinetobacter baumannii]
MKFEELRNLLSETDFYKVENCDIYVALDNINLKIQLENRVEFPDDSNEKVVVACRSVFRDDIHRVKVSAYNAVFKFNGEVIQSFTLYKISGLETYSEDKVINIYLPIPKGKLIYSQIPEDDFFRRSIIKKLNNRQALEIITDTFRPSII